MDTDQTASELMQIMVRDRTGRVTFIPINRIHPKVPQYPNGQDAIPLIEKLQFDPMYRPALEQVFGKTCVCRDLTIAAAYVKSHGINTITLDGDKVDRKGALTGGYHDVRRSRLEAINSVKTLRTKFTSASEELRETTTSIQQLDQEITRTMGHIQVSSNKQTQAKASRDMVVEEIAALSRERERLVQRIERLESEVYDLESELNGLDAKLQGYRTELASPMAAGLTADEENAVEALGMEVEDRQKRLLDIGKKKNEVRCQFMNLFSCGLMDSVQLGSRKTLMEIELSEKLRRRRDELRSKIETLDGAEEGDSNTAEDLDARIRELKTLSTSIDSLTQKLKGVFA